MILQRISIDVRIMGGVPCVSGTRVPVAAVIGLMAEGVAPRGGRGTIAAMDVLVQYPQLVIEDVLACLEFAATAIDERHLPLKLPAMRFLIDERLSNQLNPADGVRA